MRTTIAFCTTAILLFMASSKAETVHALAMHGEPKYGADFDHFDYANPQASKGGQVKLAAIGTFDTLNAYTLKGVGAAGLGLIYDTLTQQSEDEAFSEYGLVAESVDMPEDRSWVSFTLRPEARFHDGSPITIEDVIFTLELFKTKAHPQRATYYRSVTGAEKIDEQTVKFTFDDETNRELPLIIGQMPVLPKAYWEGREFEKTTLDPPLGSGPYKILAVDPGRSITYQRVTDYWGKDLPINAGRHNFDTIRYDYYRDNTIALQAFKAGEYDLRSESTSKLWATGYDSPALKSGLFAKEEIIHDRPTGMQGFMFNTRRKIFQDPRVREALAYAFDFEWTNKTLFYGAYVRTNSYFSNSELAAQGLPSEEELEILEPYRDQLPERLFTTPYAPPTSDGSGNIRGNLRKALALLKKAGWEVEGGQLVNSDGAPFKFETLLVQPAFERVVLPFKKNLKRLGIEMTVRTVDVAQYQKRLDDFDFDVVVSGLGQSLSPGNEQRDFWTSSAADQPGSRNLAGIKDPVVDKLVELIVTAPDRESLIHRTRALDRVLLWGHYVIPNWHIRVFRVAFWDKFGRPKTTPKYALGFDTWWLDPNKSQALQKRKPELSKPTSE